MTPEQAKALVRERAARTSCAIAVMRHPHKEHWERVIEIFEPNWLQTDAEDFTLDQAAAELTALPVYRDGKAPADSDCRDRLLFEGTHSGSGRVADWDEASGLARVAEVILAGGLDRRQRRGRRALRAAVGRRRLERRRARAAARRIRQ